MIGRARLIRDTLAVLLGTVVLWVGVALVLPLGADIGRGVVFVALFVVAWALAARGRTGEAAGLVLGLSLPIVALEIVYGGGPTSDLAPYAPLLALIAWSWLGRRWGLLAIALLDGSLAVGWWLHPQLRAWPIAHVLASHLAAACVGAAFLGAVTRDLRRAAESAWRHAAEAEQAALEAAEANDARDRFLAAVSHELRTPLDAVLGYAELVLEEETDPDRLADVGRIRAAGEQLLALVNDLLDLARPSSGRDEPFPEFEVEPLLGEVVETTAPMVAERGNRVAVRAIGELPTVCSDRRRIRQILLNLVSNAAKYTSGGEIGLEVEARGDEVLWRVRDCGIGIPREKLHQLFQPFLQLHDGPDRRPGMGLGLALSQRLAERLGGRIEAESELGRGSTFTLRLPVRPPPGAASRTSGSLPRR